MDVLFLILLLVGAICFAASVFGVSTRVNLLALGLLAWILVPLIHTVVGLN